MKGQPYFQEAMAGRPACQLAPGAATGNPTLCGLSRARRTPTHNRGRRGGKGFRQTVHADFVRFPRAFLVDSRGTVFISSSRNAAVKSLWPADGVDRKSGGPPLSGADLSKPVLSAEPINDSVAVVDSRRVIVARTPTGFRGIDSAVRALTTTSTPTGFSA